MLSTDEQARAVCNAVAKHEGIAWAGMVLRGREPTGPGEVVGYAFVRWSGSQWSARTNRGWWCVYLGFPRNEPAASVGELKPHGGIHTSPCPPLFIPPVEGFSRLKKWAWWAYNAPGDSLRRGDGLRRWPLEVVVEQELMDAVARLYMGDGYPARGIAGRVVSPEEWIYGR